MSSNKSTRDPQPQSPFWSLSRPEEFCSTREGPPLPESSYAPVPTAPPQETVHPGIVREPAKKVPLSVQERIRNWFVRPLRNFGSEDVFICLGACVPLIEKHVRYRLKLEGHNESMSFSEGSMAVRFVANLLKTSDYSTTSRLWGAVRNGLLHRSQIKGGLEYILMPEKSGHPAFELSGTVVTIYPLIVCELVAEMADSSPEEMWTQNEYPLPDVYRLT